MRKSCQYCRRLMRPITIDKQLPTDTKPMFRKDVPAVVCDYCDRTAMMPARAEEE